jgi:hypothetical protein
MALLAGDLILNMILMGKDQSLGRPPRIRICLIRLCMTDIAVLGGRVPIVATLAKIHGWQQIVRNTLAGFNAFMAFAAVHPHVFNVQYVGENDLIGWCLGCYPGEDYHTNREYR